MKTALKTKLNPLFENEEMQMCKLLFPIANYRSFLNQYLNGTKVYSSYKRSSKHWTDEDVVRFCNANFEFFLSFDDNKIVFAIPKCTTENAFLKKYLLKF